MPYWLYVLIIVAIVAFNGGKKSEKGKAIENYLTYEAEIALGNAKTEKANTRIEKGKADKQKLIADYEQEIADMQYDIADTYQEPGLPEASVDELIIFEADITKPEIVEVIEDILEEVVIIDSTTYPYRDKANGYSVDFNIKYDSKPSLFYVTPENLHVVHQKPPEPKDTTIGVWYLTENCFLVSVQYDLLPFLVIGGSAGWSDDPVVGVKIGRASCRERV